MNYSLLGIAHPVVGPHFRYRTGTGTTLNRGLNCEESRIVALVVVLTCIYMFCIRVL